MNTPWLQPQQQSNHRRMKHCVTGGGSRWYLLSVDRYVWFPDYCFTVTVTWFRSNFNTGFRSATQAHGAQHHQWQVLPALKPNTAATLWPPNHTGVNEAAEVLLRAASHCYGGVRKHHDNKAGSGLTIRQCRNADPQRGAAAASHCKCMCVCVCVCLECETLQENTCILATVRVCVCVWVGAEGDGTRGRSFSITHQPQGPTPLAPHQPRPGSIN